MGMSYNANNNNNSKHETSLEHTRDISGMPLQSSEVTDKNGVARYYKER